MRSRLLRRFRLRESWVIFFVLGIIMMNFPFIKIFSEAEPFFNIPMLFLYLQIGWLISICVIYLFTKSVDLPEEDDHKGERR